MSLLSGEDRVLNCNDATLSGDGSQISGVFVACEQWSAYNNGCTPTAKVLNCNIENFNSGINVKLADGTILKNNNISNTGAGIIFFGVQNGLIVGNNISSTATASHGPGIRLKRNVTYNVTYQRRSESNEVIGNTITDTGGYGIQLSSTLFNLIRDNTITDSGYDGIYLYEGSENEIFNNYLANDSNVRSYPLGSTWSNTWNTVKTLGENIVGGSYLGGNYWDDYTGTDGDGDGLGDTPYIIPSTYWGQNPADNPDNHPLIQP